MQSAHPSSRLAYLAGLMGFSFVAFFGTAVLGTGAQRLTRKQCHRALESLVSSFGPSSLAVVIQGRNNEAVFTVIWKLDAICRVYRIGALKDRPRDTTISAVKQAKFAEKAEALE